MEDVNEIAMDTRGDSKFFCLLSKEKWRVCAAMLYSAYWKHFSGMGATSSGEHACSKIRQLIFLTPRSRLFLCTKRHFSELRYPVLLFAPEF